MPSFEAVVVTYQQDFPKLKRCLDGMQSHGLGHGYERVVVVLHDDRSLLDTARAFIPDNIRFDLVHYSEFAEWVGPLDWHSQQWIKLAVSKIVSAEWYLLIDSDVIFYGAVDYSDLFYKNKAFERRTLLTDLRTESVDQLGNAYAYWQHPMDNVTHYMRDITPFMMHTHTARTMLPQVDPAIFDPWSGKPTTQEFLLWSAYLDQQGIKDQLYQPLSQMTSRIETNCHPSWEEQVR
jgi:hypothetical protein